MKQPTMPTGPYEQQLDDAVEYGLVVEWWHSRSPGRVCLRFAAQEDGLPWAAEIAESAVTDFLWGLRIGHALTLQEVAR